MKTHAFALAGDRFRIRIDAGPDGSCALEVVNEETDLVLHFDSPIEAILFGESIARAANNSTATPEALPRSNEEPLDCNGTRLDRGDTVQCVDANGSAGLLVDGKQYKVTAGYGIYVKLAGVLDPIGEPTNGWHARRFKIVPPF